MLRQQGLSFELKCADRALVLSPPWHQMLSLQMKPHVVFPLRSVATELAAETGVILHTVGQDHICQRRVSNDHKTFKGIFIATDLNWSLLHWKFMSSVVVIWQVCCCFKIHVTLSTVISLSQVVLSLQVESYVVPISGVMLAEITKVIPSLSFHSITWNYVWKWIVIWARDRSVVLDK